MDIVFIVVASTGMVTLMSFAVVGLFLRLRNRQLRHQNELLALSKQFSQELLVAQNEVTEQAFKNIAAELHDSICTTMNSAVLQLNKAELKKEFGPDTISAIRTTVRQATSDVRDISHTLDRDYMKHFDLKSVLKKLTQLIQKNTEIDIKLTIEPDIIFSTKDHEIMLIRILQELINNSMKHGNAKRIDLRIENATNGVSIIYADDGDGFNETAKVEGMGLLSIKQRLELIKAIWEINSSPGNGFHFQATIPITNIA